VAVRQVKFKLLRVSFIQLCVRLGLLQEGDVVQAYSQILRQLPVERVDLLRASITDD